MAIWRMAMRHGSDGPFTHEAYVKMGVGAITYLGVEQIDFTNLSLSEAKKAWAHLPAPQISSLKHLCYEFAGGDTVFLKKGPLIINSGIVRGEIGKRAYQFNYAKDAGLDPDFEHWYQQVPITWRNDFASLRIQVGSNQRFAIQKISREDAERIGQGLDEEIAAAPVPSQIEELLRTESYLRATSASMRTIVRHHNRLSNEFRKWLDREHSIAAQQEKSQIDIRFKRGRVNVFAELKICDGGSTRHGIREALGQLLEYNFYPRRENSAEWLIVLDTEPSRDDVAYIGALREKLSFPIHVGWRSKSGFSFAPSWPRA